METYAKVLTYAIPGFVVLIVIEYAISKLKGVSVNEPLDTISSLSSGMTNTLKDILGIAVVIVSYSWMVEHFALVSIASSVALYFIAFILIDFASYWSHRFNHEINVMWNRHIIHHSSEEFNLSCALRQSISGIFQVYFFLSIPMALMGIPVEVIAITAPLHLFAQFWYHTRLIGKMGWLEHIIVTPSHHRVHHAINDVYIDKNYSAIFIIWDKIFGTFKEEDPNVAPRYGVKKPVRTWNPFIINYQHLFMLITDTWRTKNWIDKIKIWVMPTGWRPIDVANLYPIQVINDNDQYDKYAPSLPSGVQTWSWIQLIIHNILMFSMLISISSMPKEMIIIFTLFLAISIFAYTSLMDLHPISLGVEFLKFCVGFYMFFTMGSELLTMFGSSGQIIFIFYLVISLIVTSWYIYYSLGKTKFLKKAVLIGQ